MGRWYGTTSQVARGGPVLKAECCACGRLLPGGGYHSLVALEAAMIEHKWSPSLDAPCCPDCRPHVDIEETYDIRGEIHAAYWHTSHRIIQRHHRRDETFDRTACDKWIKVTPEAMEICFPVTPCLGCAVRDLAARDCQSGARS